MSQKTAAEKKAILMENVPATVQRGLTPVVWCQTDKCTCPSITGRLKGNTSELSFSLVLGPVSLMDLLYGNSGLLIKGRIIETTIGLTDATPHHLNINYDCIYALACDGVDNETIWLDELPS